MDKFKDVAKGGWHPKGKDGKGESWRGDFKGINQVAGWMGKGKDTSQPAGARDYQSRPLRSLRDPAEFGPPPRRVDYPGSASAPVGSTSDGRVLGELSWQSQARIHTGQEQDVEVGVEEESTRPAPPAAPFRADTTGLSIDHLPKPPLRKIHQSELASAQAPARTQKPKPALPPRLPQRQTSGPIEHSVSPPPLYSQGAKAVSVQENYLNQGSLNRLSSAGVSVSGLNIGGSSNPWQNEASSSAPGPTSPQLSEPQSRFSKMSTASPNAEAPVQGTSFAQKQAALKTASSFRNDPSSVSLADARSAASTANNFKQRHGDQVASGWKSANGLNQKYGITNKVNSYGSGGNLSHVDADPSAPVSPVISNPAAAIAKKKPPPPPTKATNLSRVGSGILEPPPLPLSSKPKF